MADWERVARYVLDERVSRGWSQQDLADRAGVKNTTVSAVETAKGRARPATLAAIGHALGWRVGSWEKVAGGGEPDREPNPDADPDEQARELMRRRAALVAAREAIEAEIAELDGELEIRNARRAG